jgi:eukaryotic-like serine/threonine-protein kinase
MNWEGTVLGGKYALLTKLGQGGMGSVWRAEHIQLRSPVAVKLIDAQIVANPEALARFMREAQSAAALRSPHVVQILDYGADRGVPYIAMELLEGESLAHRLARVGRLPPAQTAHIMTHVGRAIGKAHEAGVVHRDLKPDNIFVVHNDDEEVAKVLDFGIAKASGGSFGVGTGSATRTGAILGTPYYMSPEQAEGTKLVDHRTDIWALGVIAYECLVGQRPFESEALGSLLLAICTRPLPVPSQVADVPVGFDAWFARACARELPDRFQSAREAASELRSICGAGTTTGGLGRSRMNDGRPSAVAGVAGTSQTNAYAASVGIDAQKRKGPLVVALLLALAFVVVAVAGGTAYVLRQNDAAAAASSALEPAPVVAGEPVPTAAEPPAAAPSPSVSAAPVVAVAPVAAPLPQPAAAPATQATRPKTAAAKTLKTAKTAAVVDKKPVTVSAPKPAAVAPPPAAPKPAAKPSVNLGI